MHATPAGLHRHGLGSFSFARRYWRNHFCFLFLRLLRCFSSPGLASLTLYIQVRITEVRLCWVPPFGYPRIYASLQLPVAFRSWPRPSSPPGTQASTIRPLYLDLSFSFGNATPSCFITLFLRERTSHLESLFRTSFRSLS